MPNYISEVFLNARNTVPVTTVDEIFTKINEWYEEAINKNFKAEKIAQYKIVVSYICEYPVPEFYFYKIIDEYTYDNGIPAGDFLGWQKKIRDFKVLD